MKNAEDLEEFTWEEVRKMVEKIKTGMFTTFFAEYVWGRPMHCCLDEDENTKALWIFTKKTNLVCDEVRAESKCFIGFSAPNDNTYLSLRGIATLSFDQNKMEKLWSPIMKAWYPNGLEDPEICLIKFEPTKGEVWDGPSSKIIQFGKILASIVSGKEYGGKSAGHGLVELT